MRRFGWTGRPRNRAPSNPRVYIYRQSVPTPTSVSRRFLSAMDDRRGVSTAEFRCDLLLSSQIDSEHLTPTSSVAPGVRPCERRSRVGGKQAAYVGLYPAIHHTRRPPCCPEPALRKKNETLDGDMCREPDWEPCAGWGRGCNLPMVYCRLTMVVCVLRWSSECRPVIPALLMLLTESGGVEKHIRALIVASVEQVAEVSEITTQKLNVIVHLLATNTSLILASKHIYLSN